ncbi:MAG TPA: hypothetical protein VK843_06440 [Planctomycetota bacterium]|nr:hypothetical protein [Planctomycetota bacterium]
MDPDTSVVNSDDGASLQVLTCLLNNGCNPLGKTIRVDEGDAQIDQRWTCVAGGGKK